MTSYKTIATPVRKTSQHETISTLVKDNKYVAYITIKCGSGNSKLNLQLMQKKKQ